MRVRRHAPHRHVLQAENLRHVLKADGHALRGCGAAVGFDVLLKLGEPVLLGIDRAAERAAAFERPKRNHQIIQPQRGPAGGHADHAAQFIHREALGGAGDHEVFRFGIDEHVIDPLQTGEKLHLRRHGRFGFQTLFDGGFQADQRNLPQIAGNVDIGVHVLLGKRFELGFVELARFGFGERGRDDALGINRNPARTAALAVSPLAVPAARHVSAAETSTAADCDPTCVAPKAAHLGGNRGMNEEKDSQTRSNDHARRNHGVTLKKSRIFEMQYGWPGGEPREPFPYPS